MLGQQAMLMGGGQPLMQRVGDFRLGKRSKAETFNDDLYNFIPTLSSCTPGDIALAMPSKILRAIWRSMKLLDTIIPGVLHPSTVMYYPEIKLYGNRPRSSTATSRLGPGIWMIGDGAGTSRGSPLPGQAASVQRRESSRRPDAEGRTDREVHMESRDMIAIDTAAMPWEKPIPRQPSERAISASSCSRDPDTGMEVRLLRYPAGFMTTWHTHNCAHGMYVLEGTLVTHAGSYGPGGFVWFTGRHAHGARRDGSLGRGDVVHYEQEVRHPFCQQDRKHGTAPIAGTRNLLTTRTPVVSCGSPPGNDSIFERDDRLGPSFLLQLIICCKMTY